MLFDCKAPCGTSPRPLAPSLLIVSGSERLLAVTRCSPARCSGSKKSAQTPAAPSGPRPPCQDTHDQPISQSALFPQNVRTNSGGGFRNCGCKSFSDIPGLVSTPLFTFYSVTRGSGSHSDFLGVKVTLDRLNQWAANRVTRCVFALWEEDGEATQKSRVRIQTHNLLTVRQHTAALLCHPSANQMLLIQKSNFLSPPNLEKGRSSETERRPDEPFWGQSDFSQFSKRLNLSQYMYLPAEAVLPINL